MQQQNGASSSSTEALKCPDCGAPLTFKPGETQVICPYCGSSVQLTPEQQGESIAQTAQLAPNFSPQPVRIPVNISPPRTRRSTFVVLLSVIGFIVICVAGLGVFTQLIFRATGTFDLAMQQAQANPEVTRVFGQPLQPGLFIFGSVETSGNSGHANYDIPIFGPLRSGTLHVSGSLTRDGWNLDLAADYQQDGKEMSIDIPAPR